MAIPVTNATCDIVHTGSVSPPDISGVPIYLKDDWKAAQDAAVAGTTNVRWTHLGLFPPTTDIRDAFAPGAPGADGLGAGMDYVYVPSYAAFIGGTGTAFAVIFIARHSRGGSWDHKRVYLQRQGISTWPNHNV